MGPITNEEDVKYYLGRHYFQSRDYRKAIEAYEEGLVINPKSIILLYEAGLAYLKLKNHSKTRVYWAKLLKIAPHSFLAVKAQGDLGD
ncbi:MAG TPA: tetratricopeptide repeat protein [Candidatus Omnitrophica bacterium]|nr:tetratricopeptide repeat protein [Candidatus Omnitrophota bacterium]